MEAAQNDKSITVKEQLQALIKLQSVEDEITQRRGKINNLQQVMVEKEKELHQYSDNLSQNKQNLENSLKERHEAELTTKEKQEQVQKLGSQLFEVKTNEAYTALQSEIKQKKSENSILEERIIEMMLAEDDLKLQLKKAEQDLAEAQQKVNANQEDLKKQIAALEQEISGFEKDWEEASKKVQKDYLERYIALCKSKEGKALVKIENDICMGCRLAIRPQATIELKKFRSLLTCDNCGRILYVE